MDEREPSLSLDEAAHQQFAQAIAEGYELAVIWHPSADRLITILSVWVNGHKIVSNDTHMDSPYVIAHIPPPDPDNKFLVAWAISPEVAVDGIAIGLRNRETNVVRLVGRSPALQKGQLFQNSGTPIAAP